MSKIDDFNLESFDDGTIRLSFTGPFSILKKILAESTSIDQLQDNLTAASKAKETTKDPSKVNPKAIVLHDPVHIDQFDGVVPLSNIELCDLVRIPVVTGDYYVFTDEEIEIISEKTGVPFVIVRNGEYIPIGWEIQDDKTTAQN